MKEIIGKIQRDRKYVYVIDRKGNIIKEKYNWFKDWRTYLMLFLLIVGYLYFSEVKIARQFIDSPCVKMCLIENYLNDFRNKNPSTQINCNYETRICQFYGILNEDLEKQIKTFENLNLTINYSNG